MKVEFNKKSENEFFGMTNTLRLSQNGSKGMVSDLDAAWKEAKTPAQKELFWSLLFSFGDVANRQHLGFESKVDNGGHAQREYFRNSLSWMWAKVKSEGLDSKRFLELVVEYTTLDNLLAARVQTKKKTKQLIKSINMIEVFGIESIVPILVQMFHGSEFDKYRVARFLVGYTFTRRKVMLEATTKNMESRKRLLEAFVKASGLGSVEAYKEWKRQYKMENIMFSTGAIKDLDREEFLDLIEKMPGNARFRVRNRLFDEKWAKLSVWFNEWEKSKETAQAEVRELTENARQGIEVDKARLATVKKAAKVNSAAKSFSEAFEGIMSNKFDNVSIQGMLEKVNLNYNTLVIVDTSGSMRGQPWGAPYNPLQFAAFMATVCLLKNPDDEAADVLGMFSHSTEFVTGNTTGVIKSNQLLRGTAKQLTGPLVDRTKTFEENFKNIYSILYARGGGSTDFASIIRSVKEWVRKDPSAVDVLASYPIWTIITDGEFNNSSNVLQSLMVAQREMEQIVGFAPFIMVIDVARLSSADIRHFDGADNFMHVPPSPGAIEQILTNFKDMDVRDVYVPLLGVHRTNRYAPVRNWVSERSRPS